MLSSILFIIFIIIMILPTGVEVKNKKEEGKDFNQSKINFDDYNMGISNTI